ncbi:MAG: peptidylprolyl isomerase [Ignavibacteriales bacterium]|nr:MAG: parvulin peptidyl-prolyl isomerase [Ignavibacteriaceae bacterium]MBW7872587.1 peptidylprolyl isomerase [Ignavibacteria bacterium]MCZ2141860.1 peptidylprolyl isomerase [Ignavibacteriales bacterium]OQY76348.1 MAG: parvulin peptidyl-prolyl isomerase [Ignavibacteriales bacterium UTCHB3]MBV6445027.1 Chaperone SurA [Ignavibacteriaceae bacterium]
MLKKAFLVFLLLFGGGTLFAQEVIEKIAAIVDNDVILESEVKLRAMIEAQREGVNPNDKDFQAKVLESMIEEKLLYAWAVLDSIIVTKPEIDQYMNYQIQQLVRQFGSEEEVERQYKKSIAQIKRELEPEIEKNLLMKKAQDKKFASVQVSRREVEEFYKEFRDSLGNSPEKVKLSHIFRSPVKSERLKKIAHDFAETLLDSIKHGADFAEMAKKYSQDPGSAVNGGDLGWAPRGMFFPEFESVAFRLRVGEVSDVIESPVGYHIIQLMDRRGEQIRARHILIQIKPDDESDIEAINFLSALRDSLLFFNADFKTLARKYSQDERTAKSGGSLGSYYIDKLDPDLKEAIRNLKEGGISTVKRIDYAKDEYGFHLVKVDERIPAHYPNLELDYDEIQELALMHKKQKLESEWFDELKSKIYWEIK